MITRKIVRVGLVGAVLLGAASGCPPEDQPTVPEIAGALGNYRFSCGLDCDLHKQSIAPGGTLNLNTVGAEVATSESSDPSVFTVKVVRKTPVAGQVSLVLAVEGVAPGTAEIVLRDGTSAVVERLPLRVATIATIELVGGAPAATTRIMAHRVFGVSAIKKDSAGVALLGTGALHFSVTGQLRDVSSEFSGELDLSPGEEGIPIAGAAGEGTVALSGGGQSIRSAVSIVGAESVTIIVAIVGKTTFENTDAWGGGYDKIAVSVHAMGGDGAIHVPECSWTKSENVRDDTLVPALPTLGGNDEAIYSFALLSKGHHEVTCTIGSASTTAALDN